MKKIIGILVATIYMTIIIFSMVHAGWQTEDERVLTFSRDGVQYLKFTTTANAGAGGVKFRTLGWQIAFEVAGSTYKMIYPMNDGGQTGDIVREIPFRGEYGAILETLCRAYGNGGNLSNPDSDDIKLINYMFTGGTVHIDAVQTVMRNGVYDYEYANTNNGALNLNNAGQLQGSQFGLHFSYSSISKAVAWSGTALADLQDYYNIPKKFLPEQVPHYLHFDYAEYMEGDSIYDSVIFSSEEDYIIAGVNTKKDITVDDYSNNTRKFKKLMVSYDGNIKHSFIDINSRTVHNFDFGATGSYNPHIYFLSLYEVKKPANPEALLGVKDKSGSTVYTEDGHQFFTTEDTMDLTLVDRSYYDDLNVDKLIIRDSKNGAVSFTGSSANTEYDLRNKPIGTYKYELDITLEGGKKISDTISFEIVKGEETEEESTLKANGTIDAPEAVLEIYNTADITYRVRASSNYLLNGWSVREGEEYVIGETRGDFEGYSDSITLKLRIPVGVDVPLSVRVTDESGEKKYAEDIAHVNKKKISPVAGLKIKMLKEEPDKYTSKEYKQYKKIKVDAGYSDILTDDDILEYAPNDYTDSQTVIEIQPVTASGDIDAVRLSAIKFADNSLPIMQANKIILRGDKLKSEIAYLRFDAPGYYRLRNQVYNGVRLSAWSSWTTIYVAPEEEPIINRFEIIAMEKDLEGNYYTTSKYYNNALDMWSIYRNSSDLTSRFKIRANYISSDDEIGDIKLFMSYDANGDLSITNDGSYTNMLITKDTNSLTQIEEQDVFRVVSKKVGQNISEIIFEVSNDKRNLFGKLHFELEIVEKPIYPNYTEGSLSTVPILSANILSLDNTYKNIYIDNLPPNLSAETEKDGTIEIYLQNEATNSYYSSLEPSLLGVFKTRLSKITFNPTKILNSIVSKDSNLWEGYSTYPYGYKVGNTSGNYQMGGMYTGKDGWIYYINGKSIRKYKLGTWDEDSLVCVLPVSGDGKISLVSGWFYFDSENSIWRIKEDGTKPQQILSLSTSYYKNTLSDFVVKDDYIYFLRKYRKEKNDSQRDEIIKMYINKPLLDFTHPSWEDSDVKVIIGGSYSYSNLSIEDNFLLYTRDGEPYTYDIIKSSSSFMADREGTHDLIGYKGYLYFFGSTTRQDHIYRVPLVNGDRDYDSVDGDEGHIYNFNLLNNKIFFVKNSTFENPSNLTRLYKADANGKNSMIIDDNASSGTEIYTMGGYIVYNGIKYPAWDLPIVTIDEQSHKYGDNTIFSISGTVTGEGTVWVRCKIGDKLVKQEFLNPKSAPYSFTFNTSDFEEGVYEDILITATTSNGVYNKAEVGDIIIRKVLVNLKANVSGMPITGNNSTRIIFLDNDTKLDDNAENQALVASIKLLLSERAVGIYSSDVSNSIIKSLVADYSGVVLEDNYNLITDNIGESANKVSNYIDVIKSVTNSVYFAIGRDELKFIKTFYDEEKDYRLSDSYTIIGKTTKSNNMLLEIVKNEKEGTLKITYEHDPSVWHNPVATYPNTNNNVYHIVSSKYDELNGKNIIMNLLGNEYLMGPLTEGMRGKWKAKLEAYDDTGNPLFDKPDTTEVSYYIHMPPVPIFTAMETEAELVLSDNGSYDIDMQYSHNNGIAKYKWRYLVRESNGQEIWIDAGEGEELKFVNILKEGRNIVDYELTVWDLQGCSTSISKNYLLLNYPNVDFDFYIADNVYSYIYKGNKGSEKPNIEASIVWKDEAYNPSLYDTSGERKIKITNNSFAKTNVNEFNLEVLSRDINQLEADRKITVKLEATNKYDLASIIKKSIDVKEIYTVNYTNTFATYDTDKGKAFMMNSNIPITVELKCDDGINNYAELIVKVNSLDMEINNALLKYQEGERYIGNFKLPEKEKVTYTINVYSARTGQLINSEEYASYVFEVNPEDILSLNNFRLVQLKDTKLKSYFTDTISGESCDIEMGVNLMAIDSSNFGGTPVTKGYKFLFKIDSNNLNNVADKIVITPSFYTINGSTRDYVERDIYWTDTEGNIYEVGEGAHTSYKEIVLTEENRTVVAENQAVWQGEYMIPATAFAVVKGHKPNNINDGNLKKDIIVAFDITAQSELGETYNYNTQNWIIERTSPKSPYEIGDVIRYNYTKDGALEDIGVYRVR